MLFVWDFKEVSLVCGLSYFLKLVNLNTLTIPCTGTNKMVSLVDLK